MAKKKDSAGQSTRAKIQTGIKSRGKRKLTDAQVLSIVAKYGVGDVTMKTLAAENSVTTATISAIIHGRTYIWLTGIGRAQTEDLQQAA